MGEAATEPRYPTKIADAEALEYALVKLDIAINASPELVRATLAAVCDRAISMARKYRCSTNVPKGSRSLGRAAGAVRS